MWLPGANTEEKSNVAGMTPTTVNASLLSVSGRPTMAGSAAKRRCHKPWLRISAFGPFTLSNIKVGIISWP